MTNALELAALIASWALVISRAPLIRRGPRKRALWLVFATLATGITFGRDDVNAFAERVTGVIDIGAVVKDLFGLATGAAIAAFAAELTVGGDAARRIRRRWNAVAAAAAVALTIAFTLVPRHPHTNDFLAAYAGDPAAGAYWIVFETYLGTAMVWIGVLLWRYARRTPRSPALIGLWIFGVGVALGLAYAAQRIVSIVAGLVAGPAHASRADPTLSKTLLALCLLCVAIGSSFPAAAGVWRAVRRYRELRRLYPLWRRLAQACPHITLEPPHGPLRDALRLSRLDWRLRRRVIEIDDGLLAMRDYVDAATHQLSREHASAANLTGTAHSAAATACWLAVALVAKRSGGTPSAGGVGVAVGGEDLDSDARWLIDVGRHLRGPLVARFVDVASPVRSSPTATETS